MSMTLADVRAKSDPKLQNLLPVVQAAAEALIERAYRRGVSIIITAGFRTYAEQNALYAQGRNGDNRPIVTNARGGQSNHNFGVAIDFALLLPSGREVSWDTLRDGDKDSLPDWSEVVEEAKRIGFSWGGDWRSFKDMPHLEMTFGLSTMEYAAGIRPSRIDMAAAMARFQAQEVEIEDMEKVKVFVNGKVVDGGLLDSKNGVTYLPVRSVADALGAAVQWDGANKAVKLTSSK